MADRNSASTAAMLMSQAAKSCTTAGSASALEHTITINHSALRMYVRVRRVAAVTPVKSCCLAFSGLHNIRLASPAIHDRPSKAMMGIVSPREANLVSRFAFKLAVLRCSCHRIRPRLGITSDTEHCRHHQNFLASRCSVNMDRSTNAVCCTKIRGDTKTSRRA
jgi:hypothetical protein